jgi:methionyl-tRNA formyltransferase
VSATAVVFAYHDVGVRCLSALLARGVSIPLVVTHRDDPAENVWFASVAKAARHHGLAVATPEDANDAAFIEKLRHISPQFVFSFYYRQMLGASALRAARRGGYNVHGSLLPKYRGRAPVNWAVLHGERETGATLHRMEAKPDAGDIVDRMAVPILPDDLAIDVFRKVTVAAEVVVHRSVPALIAGEAPHVKQDLAAGSYYGGRRPEDGRIDWSRPAESIHNLVRAVAPPYPGAFTEIGAERVAIHRTRVLGPAAGVDQAQLHFDDDTAWVDCADGKRLAILEVAVDGRTASPRELRARIGDGPHRLASHP